MNYDKLAVAERRGLAAWQTKMVGLSPAAFRKMIFAAGIAKVTRGSNKSWTFAFWRSNPSKTVRKRQPVSLKIRSGTKMPSSISCTSRPFSTATMMVSVTSTA
jgi:hypothetical protein